MSQMGVDPQEVWRGGREGRGPYSREEPPLGELLKQLSEDGTRLVRQEVALAKAEFRETAVGLGKDATRLGVAVGLGLLGAMAATAFAIIAIGDALNNYWVSALLVTALLLGVAAFLAKNALDDIKRREIKPTETIATLRSNAEWAKQEVEAVKQEWKS